MVELISSWLCLLFSWSLVYMVFYIQLPCVVLSIGKTALWEVLPILETVDPHTDYTQMLVSDNLNSDSNLQQLWNVLHKVPDDKYGEVHTAVYIIDSSTSVLRSLVVIFWECVHLIQRR